MRQKYGAIQATGSQRSDVNGKYVDTNAEARRLGKRVHDPCHEYQCSKQDENEVVDKAEIAGCQEHRVESTSMESVNTSGIDSD